jgi:hypothetical protein
VAQGLWAGAIHHKIGLLFIPLISLGLVRLGHGINVGHPVGYLVVLLIITVLTPLIFARNKRTGHGDEVLQCIKDANESGNMQRSLGYIVAIAGLSVLADTAFADMWDALTLHRGDGGAGGCGGDGGGCGGGCGGCGV